MTEENIGVELKKEGFLRLPQNLYEWVSLVSLIITFLIGLYLFWYPRPSEKKLMDYQQELNEAIIDAKFITDIFKQDYLDGEPIPLTARSYTKKKNDPITGELSGQKWWINGVEKTGRIMGILVLKIRGHNTATNVKLNIWRSFHYPETRIDKTQYWSLEDSNEWQKKRDFYVYQLHIPDSTLKMIKKMELHPIIGTGETNIFLGDFQPGDTKELFFEMQFPRPPRDTSDCDIRPLDYDNPKFTDFLKLQIRCDNRPPVDVPWEYR